MTQQYIGNREYFHAIAGRVDTETHGRYDRTKIKGEDLNLERKVDGLLFRLCRFVWGHPQGGEISSDMDKRVLLSHIIPTNFTFLALLLLVFLLFPLSIVLLLMFLRRRGNKDEKNGDSQRETVEAWSLSIPQDTKTE
jgi:hypothetical protein